MTKSISVKTQKIKLTRPDTVFAAAIAIVSTTADFDPLSLDKYLHNQEKKQLQGLKAPARQRSFILGRYAVKLALKKLAFKGHLKQIKVINGVFGQPVIHCKTLCNMQTAISHSDHTAAAVVFPEEHPVNVDVEFIRASAQKTLNNCITDWEKKAVKETELKELNGLFCLWSAKESLSKMLKIGMTSPFRIFEIKEIKTLAHGMLIFYRHFGQYKTISWQHNNYIFSLTIPAKTETDLDLPRLKI
ncbi:MAG TPA: 4'-phosphopantetheinyl transferase superfamily protein [Spirochaetota bacterium]|nr:4'-phosphopantetheinyl transferase superfamily protein [Spirochaetota bacterium]